MRDFAPIQLMTPRKSKLILSLAVAVLLAAAFRTEAAVPFSLSVSGNYANGFFGNFPYFVIHNESRYNITQFQMTIGNIDKNFDAVWLDDQSCSFHRALHRAGERDADFFACEASAEAASLVAAGVGEEHVDGAGETIFGGELSGAVADEVDACCHARILPEKKKARDL